MLVRTFDPAAWQAAICSFLLLDSFFSFPFDECSKSCFRFDLCIDNIFPCVVRNQPFTLQIAIGGSRCFQLISAILASQRFQSDFDSSWNSLSGQWQLVVLMCHVQFSVKNEFVHLETFLRPTTLTAPAVGREYGETLNMAFRAHFCHLLR